MNSWGSLRVRQYMKRIARENAHRVVTLLRSTPWFTVRWFI